jgi:hypothetical protein
MLNSITVSGFLLFSFYTKHFFTTIPSQWKEIPLLVGMTALEGPHQPHLVYDNHLELLFVLTFITVKTG